MATQNYLCIQKSEPRQMPKGERPSPAQMQEMYEQFNTWRATFAANIVDIGGRLGGGKVVTSDGALDGASIEAKEIIGGYMILRAGSVDEAAEIASQCPGVVRPGSSVEVREISTP